MSIISVQGNIGAGKSTLLGLLNMDTIKQPVDEWENTAGSNILQRYYENPQRWAFTFQLNALHSRCKLWEQTIKQNENKLFFSERSPLADRHIFGQIMQKEGNFQALEYAVYDSLCKSIMKNLPLRGIVYLKCSPELCLQRIKKRNRKGQQGISLQYLQKLHEKHQSWINRQKDFEILVVDTEFYDIQKQEDQLEVRTQIVNFIQKISNK